ncbi:MAG: ammonium transporter [Dehalococcoidia bacterium]|nr:ammonium transporter [Dehalococcoidia bacterium]
MPTLKATMTPGMLRGLLLVLLGIGLFVGSGATALAAGGDPTGADTLAADPNAGLNFAWVLVTGFLVFSMQLGFALLGAGLMRAKHTVNYMTKSFMDFCITGISYWAFGFALMFGASGAVIGGAVANGLTKGNWLIGYSGFFLTSDAYDVTTIALWFFQMIFAATAATIVAGMVAERMKITAYLAYSFLIGAIIYPIYGHWVWGGGWLATLPFGSGARDFAGSGAVHVIGGTVGLMGAWLVGPRIGKFNADGTPNQFKGHNLVYVVAGTFILFFGWFGFNPGTTLAATDLRISVIAVNTFLAGATGAVVALYLGIVRTGKADIIAACNGSLAGLVGVTASVAYVAPWAAVVIGAVAPLVQQAAANFVERRLRIDDVVGAFGVHAGGGLWGLLAVGIFADGTYGGVSGLVAGEGGQLVAQLISMGTVAAWGLGTGFLVFGLLKKTVGLRASREEEMEGLDMPEHGIEAYPQQVD